ncbi:MAG: leucine-rich repeat domain-containing protein [Clostridia bacterium]|nr:leucine-rich repeat domain-containing protein [Clostridia bacterium]
MLTEYVGRKADVIVPDEVTVIGEKAFFMQNIRSVVLPEGVTAIMNSAFSFCRSLVSVELPAGLVEIGAGAFMNCTELSDITLPDSLVSIGAEAFNFCRSLKSVTVPAGVRSIGKSAFCHCDSLKTLEFPGAPAKIGASAFALCPRLRNFTFSGGFSAVIDIKNSFDLTNICVAGICGTLTAPADLTDAVAEYTLANREKCVLAAENAVFESGGVEALKNLIAFTGRPSPSLADEYIERASDFAQLTAFLLEYKNTAYSPEELEAAENERFEKELGIREFSETEWRRVFAFTVSGGEVTVTDYLGTSPLLEIPAYIGAMPVTRIGARAFYGRTDIESAVLPDTVAFIGESAFERCRNLKTLVLSANLSYCGKHAFGYLCEIEKVYFNGTADNWARVRFERPDSNPVTDEFYIGGSPVREIAVNTDVRAFTFSPCRHLRKVEIGEGVRFIDNGAFSDCFHIEFFTVKSAKWFTAAADISKKFYIYALVRAYKAGNSDLCPELCSVLDDFIKSQKL